MAQLFEPIADAIVLSLAPRKVFDAGCAAGFLAEKLWDRGVETHGRDISELAISQVRADVRPWCEVGSIAEPIEGIYDLVLCIEVLEHMPTEEALASIRNITAIAPRIPFSASPTDRERVICVNVRPIRYWLERFAEAGFAPTLGFDATSLSPHAFLFERSEEGRDDRSLAAFSEIVRQRLEVVGAAALEAARREQRRIVREIRQSDLFDTGYYFANNPDVAASGIDPTMHFATNGWKEGRKPSPGFDPQFYLSKYPDVAASGMNPLLHYARTGREEGRQTLPGLHGGALTAPPYNKIPGLAAVSSVASLLRTHNAALAPLPVFADHRSAPTLTILTDRVDPDHLFGGVATAMVVGAFVAGAWEEGCVLRLVTFPSIPPRWEASYGPIG
jgi:SAM-dependent methyltransferase